jgi:hypothetical protein
MRVPSSGLFAKLKGTLPPSTVHWLNLMRMGPRYHIDSSVRKGRELFKSTHSGQRCFIIGAGPSLKGMDLSLLNSEVCFAANKGFRLTELGLRHVAYYGMSDHNAYKEYGNQIPGDFADRFLIFGSIPWLKFPDKTSYFDMYNGAYKYTTMANGFFQFDLNKPIAMSYTVVLHLLQVAVYLGFQRVYFLGVDNDFSLTNLHFYPDSAQERKNVSDWGWSTEEIAAVNETSFLHARNLLGERGLQIFNATKGGKLNALPRVPYESLFA